MMRKILLTTMALSLVVVLGGCKRTADETADEMIESMEELTEVVGTIKDKASAEEAKPKIEKLKEKMDELEEEANKLKEEMSDEEKKKFEEKYKEKGLEAVGKLLKEMMRVSLIPGVKEALDGVLDK